MSILKNIADKKNKGQINVKDSIKFYSETLGEEIECKKIPLSQFLAITEKYNITNFGVGDFVPFFNELVFHSATMFRDSEGVKAAMAAYPTAGTPMDLPELIFEGQMGEMSDLFVAIQSMYDTDVEEYQDDLKN